MLLLYFPGLKLSVGVSISFKHWSDNNCCGLFFGFCVQNLQIQSIFSRCSTNLMTILMISILHNIVLNANNWYGQLCCWKLKRSSICQPLRWFHLWRWIFGIWWWWRWAYAFGSVCIRFLPVSWARTSWALKTARINWKIWRLQGQNRFWRKTEAIQQLIMWTLTTIFNVSNMPMLYPNDDLQIRLYSNTLCNDLYSPHTMMYSSVPTGFTCNLIAKVTRLPSQLNSYCAWRIIFSCIAPPHDPFWAL